MKRSSWYILLVRQGFENTIKQQLVERKKDLQIEEITISEELSCYIFIRTCEVPNSSFYLDIDGTLKFLGTKNVPQKFSNADISKLSDEPEKKFVFQVGNQVIVKKGDLCDIQGEIISLGKRIVRIKPAIFHKIIKVNVQDIELL